MAIQQIKFSRYKSFYKEQTFDIKPITLVIGKNNAGKTALIQLPLMIGEWLNSNYGLPLGYNNEFSFAKNWKQLFFNRSEVGYLQISFTTDNDLEITVHLRLDEYSCFIALLEWKYKGESVWKAEWDEIDEKNPIYTVIYKGQQRQQNAKRLFNGITPFENIVVSQDGIEIPIEVNRANCQYIAGIRHIFTDSSLNFNEEKWRKMDTKGEFAAHVLYKNPDILTKVREWYKENMNNWGIDINKYGDNDGFDILLKDFNSGIKVILPQTGQGITQVLPLVVASYMGLEAKKEESIDAKTIIIEQPELHLHPAAHGNLMELLVDCALKYKQNYIIETHSEVMLLRLRLLVANGTLNANDVAIYWVDSGKEDNMEGSYLKEIKIDEEGNLEEWPSGIFSEDYEELMKIRKARRK